MHTDSLEVLLQRLRGREIHLVRRCPNMQRPDRRLGRALLLKCHELNDLIRKK